MIQFLIQEIQSPSVLALIIMIFIMQTRVETTGHYLCFGMHCLVLKRIMYHGSEKKQKIKGLGINKKIIAKKINNYESILYLVCFFNTNNSFACTFLLINFVYVAFRLLSLHYCSKLLSFLFSNNYLFLDNLILRMDHSSIIQICNGSVKLFQEQIGLCSG